MPISLILRPGFCLIMLTVTWGLYMLHGIIFNEFHLRMKNERVGWRILWYYVRSLARFLNIHTRLALTN